MAMVYLGLGSNLNDPPAQLAQAEQLIRALPKVTVLALSSVYVSAPLGGRDGPMYCNQVIKIQTGLVPTLLLDAMLGVERQQGRIRGAEKWGSRVIDIDLLLYDDLQMKTASLTIPHYDLHRRAFVLQPLFELDPNLVLPSGESVRALLATVESINVFEEVC